MKSSVLPALLILVCVFNPALAQEASDPTDPVAVFQAANEAYQAGDYREAIRLYEEILASDHNAPELEFNLANAHLKEGSLGRALLHYRRALRLDPKYEDAAANIRYARSLTVDVRPEEARGSWWSWTGNLRLGPLGAAVGALVAFVGFLAVAAARLRRFRDRLGPIVLQGAFAAATLLLGAALLFEWTQWQGGGEGVVVVPEVDVRSGPGPNNTVSFRLHEGIEVELLREGAGWREIKVSDGLQGWVPVEVVEEI